MSFKFNPLLAIGLDIAGSGLSQSTGDSRYVLKSGDVMTGTLDVQANAIILEASDGSRWNLTVNTDGSLQTTLIPATDVTGSPMGLLLTLTYS